MILPICVWFISSIVYFTPCMIRFKSETDGLNSFALIKDLTDYRDNLFLANCRISTNRYYMFFQLVGN